MRELSTNELHQVSGGLPPLAIPAILTIVGGATNGVQYLTNDPSPTVGGFLRETAIGALSGGLVSTGGGLIVRAGTGAAGLAVPGTVMVGLGLTVSATSGASSREDTSGGSF